MRTTLLRVLLVLLFAAPAAAIDGPKSDDGEGKESADFREMVVREREKAREEYEAMVGRRKKAMREAIARDRGVSLRGESVDPGIIDPVLRPELKAEAEAGTDDAERNRAGLFLLLMGAGGIVASGLLILGLRYLANRITPEQIEQQEFVGAEPLTMTLRPREERFSGSFPDGESSIKPESGSHLG